MPTGLFATNAWRDIFSGINIHSREIQNTNVYATSWTKCQHNKLMSTSSSDAHFFPAWQRMRAMEKKDRKQKDSMISVNDTLAVHPSLR